MLLRRTIFASLCGILRSLSSRPSLHAPFFPPRIHVRAAARLLGLGALCRRLCPLAEERWYAAPRPFPLSLKDR
eukprot:scaffold1277_cov253-Pinguiococcus_pyrenoidosus.AAC.36